MIKYSILRQEDFNNEVKSISELKGSPLVQFQIGDIDENKLINNVPDLVLKLEQDINDINIGETISLTRITTETVFITKE